MQQASRHELIVRPRKSDRYSIGISLDQYNEYIHAMKQVHSWLRLEIALDNLISEYEELETEIVRVTIADIVRSRTDYWESFMLDRQRILRKVYCALSLCGTYLDCGGSLRPWDIHFPGLSTRFKQCLITMLETDRSSQLMYVMRNVLVHQLTTPISISFPTSHDYQNDGALSTIHLRIDKRELLEDSDVSKHQELREFVNGLSDEDLDIKRHLRHYVTTIISQHCQFRDEVAATFDDLQTSIDELYDSPEGKHYEVSAVRLDRDGEIADHITIFEEPLRLIRHFVARNKHGRDLTRSIVTTADELYMKRWSASRPPITPGPTNTRA